MIKEKIYFCEHCGKIVSVLKDSPAPLICCGAKMKELTSAEAAEKLHMPVPDDKNESGNYTVCKCNNVKYFDILDEIHKHRDIHGLLNVFEEVKDTTHCSTGCGGCYDKVMSIISDEING